MTVVLVHGNPETDAVWDPLVAELGRDDVLRLSPPGWGAPVPEGWGATVAEYRDWLVRQLEEIGAPVHLVGHDWGGGHVLGVAMTRPDLLRSWCSDILGCLEPDYVWHPLAQIWQTPGVGEAAVAAFVEDPGSRLDDMASRGLDRGVGERMAAGYDATMARCILGLYRDAAQPVMARLGEKLPAAAARPGLAVLATEDHFVGTDEQRRRAAGRAGAQLVTLDGLGHWWMVQDPARGAAMLTDFWAVVGY
ncbi:MAG TPA: alpha/beta hydrolase [Pseudonocardia sp.]|nr:alpha/beta hydrolase [Pseudonocardia sp.]